MVYRNPWQDEAQINRLAMPWPTIDSTTVNIHQKQRTREVNKG
jgi:hypothetical protein